MSRKNRTGQSGESLHEEDKQAGQSGDRLHVEDKQARPIRHNITYQLPLYSINLAILKQIPFLKGFFFSFLIFDKFRLNKMTSRYRYLLRTCLKVKQNYLTKKLNVTFTTGAGSVTNRFCNTAGIYLTTFELPPMLTTIRTFFRKKNGCITISERC